MKVGFLSSFFAGIVSFFSPCILPLVPGYLSFITGLTVEEMEEGEGKLGRIALNTLFFIMGFSALFVLLGAGATAIGMFLQTHISVLRRVAGLIILLLGLHLVGLLKIKAFLTHSTALRLKRESGSIAGSFFLGVALALAWTPCIGPILGTILVYAAAQETLGEGVLMLTLYSLGLGVPFMIVALGSGALVGKVARMGRVAKILQILAGCVLIGFGLWLIIRG